MINESLVAFSVVTHHGMGNNSAVRTEMSLKKARGPGGREEENDSSFHPFLSFGLGHNRDISKHGALPGAWYV